MEIFVWKNITKMTKEMDQGKYGTGTEILNKDITKTDLEYNFK